MSLNRERGENVVTLTGDACLVTINESISLDYLILTNNRIYFSYKKTNGLFKKPEEFNFYLKDIAIVDGYACVSYAKYENDKCLEITFADNRRLYFTFVCDSKKQISEWIAYITNLLGVDSIDKRFTEELNNKTTDSFKSITSSESVSSNSRGESHACSMIEPSNIIADGNNTDNITKSIKFCTNCGTALNIEAKYCSSCGCPVSQTMVAPKDEGLLNINSRLIRETYKERQQEYVGKVYKCPNCGNTVSISDVICGACGFHLSGKIAIYSARDFQEQLMKAETNRKERRATFFRQPDVLDTTDKEIISLIKTYPIPNSMDDIIEFFHLAVGNIDIVKSKKSFFNSDTWDGGNRERAISNAWVGKLQSIYAKAELYFPNEPEFSKMKKTYDTIMTQLKLK